MSGYDPSTLPPDLPEPIDDGAAGHLRGMRVTPIRLPATDGEAEVGASPEPTVLFCYPHVGDPATGPLVPDWDLIPGARGCTPQTCGFRDLHHEFAQLGVQVLGVSTDGPGYQKEVVARLALPFPLCSDARLDLARNWRLPVFEVAGRVLLRRLTMLLRDGAVERVWYPVFPPDRHAADVLGSL